mmetsp:Transcript_49435/g.123989  ORF Transcript_49435/g.123989 Transcript_49435/m.123989 type:complete len:87 (-) Transcript_49435:2080-2340(-)
MKKTTNMTVCVYVHGQETDERRKIISSINMNGLSSESIKKEWPEVTACRNTLPSVYTDKHQHAHTHTYTHVHTHRLIQYIHTCIHT